MTTVTIIASITAHDDKIALVKAELLKLIDLTRAEEGCLQYDLHQDNKNPAHFAFYENWTSLEMLNKHLASKHLTDFKTAVNGAIAELTVSEMTKIA